MTGAQATALWEEGRRLKAASDTGKARDILFWQGWLIKNGDDLLIALGVLATLLPSEDTGERVNDV